MQPNQWNKSIPILDSATYDYAKDNDADHWSSSIISH